MPMSWEELNQRQQQYLQAIYETDQEQEADERGAWKRGGSPRPASVWRWMEYGVFDGVGSTLYTKLYLRKLIDEGTGSTFNALESRLLITCKYTHLRRDSNRRTLERFLMLQITPAGRRLVRAATGEQREKPLPAGSLREWHWRALALAWSARPTGLQYDLSGYYGRISWNTWLRLLDYKRQGQKCPLVETYTTSSGIYNESLGYTPDYHWIRLTAAGEVFYCENWQHYQELYPAVEAPDPAPESPIS